MEEKYRAYTDFARVYDLFMDDVPYEKWGDQIERIFQRAGIRDGLVLDLGCGTGRLTRIMADKGYDMIGVDISGDMLEIAREAEEIKRKEEITVDPCGDMAENARKAEKVKGKEETTVDPCGDMVGNARKAEEVKKKEGVMSDQSGALPENIREAESGKITQPDILYLLQDMRAFELYGTVRAIYSACDCVNYITVPKDLLQVFRLVNNYLDPGGLFVFDCNTPYKYSRILGENTFAENRPEGSFIWENYYDPADRINEYDLTLYIQSGENCFQRFQETHFQRCYALDELRTLIREAGMELEAVYDSYTFLEPREDCQRYTVVARERGKKDAGRF